MALYLCVLGMSMLSILVLFAWGKPDVETRPDSLSRPDPLQGGCLLAVGTFISTTTKDQIVAVVVTFHLSLLLWLLSWFTAFGSTWVSQVANYMSIVTHMENFSKGVLDLKDVVSITTAPLFFCLALFLTLRRMESLRWRS